MTFLDPIECKGNFIGGEFVRSQTKSGSFENASPSNLNEKVMETDFHIDHVEDACFAASKAFKDWSLWSVEDRMEALNRVKNLFASRQEEFATIIARETGKPLWETTLEAQALVTKFDVTFQYSLKLVEEMGIKKVLPGTDGWVRFRPRGVFAVLGPFNFPAHLPNGHIVPALVTGNTVVFKPSEYTPATGQLMAQCYQKAGLPPGVFNLIQGPGEIGRKLVNHKEVDGILFTGSYQTGLEIKKATICDYWKILALEMGGKNASIVWKDANRDKAAYETLIGAYLSSGQRCSSTSRIFVHKDIFEEFLSHFHEKARSLVIDHWSKNPFMGPVISQKSLDACLDFQNKALEEGCESIMEGKPLELDPPGFYITPGIYKAPTFDPSSVYQNTEIFGPNVAIHEIEDLDQAIVASNNSGYGLSMSVFSRDRNPYQYCLDRAQVGLLNWNRTTNGASSRLPFGGRGKSGNDRPCALFSVYYCTVPLASLEDHRDFNPDQILPGIRWRT